MGEGVNLRPTATDKAYSTEKDPTVKIYQTILEGESTKALLAHRNLVKAKILCVDIEWRKEHYQQCLDSIDDALQQIFDALYQNASDTERIDDLLVFWQVIDA